MNQKHDLQVSDDRIAFAPSDVDLDRSPLAGTLGEETYVLGAFNPALTRLANGNLLLMVRVAEALGAPVVDDHARTIRWSPDGFVVDAHPMCAVDMDNPRAFTVRVDRTDGLALTSLSWLLPVELAPDAGRIVKVHYDRAIAPQASYEAYGVEDPRISRIDGVWYMTTCAVSPERLGTALRVSHNGLDYELRGLILDHQNKDMALFEGLIAGEFVALTRPLGTDYFAYPEDSPYLPEPAIQLARSPDAHHWRPFDKPGIRARKGSAISVKVGAGAPPMLTASGWLVLYHGVETARGGQIYRTFWALLDRDDPTQILRLDERDPILRSRSDLTAHLKHHPYENDIVFTTGLVEEGDDYLIASGEVDLACRLTRTAKSTFL